MAKHLIFLVHGMGRYGAVVNGTYQPDIEGWFAKAEATLKDVYTTSIQAGVADGVAFDDAFRIVRVNYDSILETYRRDWEEQAKGWSQLGLDQSLAAGITGFFQGNTADAFLWSSVADVALYAAPTVQNYVRTEVARQMIAAMRVLAEQRALGGWSVIAHSLGSAVMTATLPLLQQQAQDDPDLGRQWTPPKVLCMVANVARALQGAHGAYPDSLAPLGGSRPSWYLNCNHRLDPIPRIAPFSPGPGWRGGESGYVDLSGLSDYYLAPAFLDWTGHGALDLDKIAAAIPHDFNHYMRQPRLAATLWPLLTDSLPSDWPQLEAQIRAANGQVQRQALATGIEARIDAALAQIEPADLSSVKAFVTRLTQVVEALA